MRASARIFVQPTVGGALEACSRWCCEKMAHLIECADATTKHSMVNEPLVFRVDRKTMDEWRG